MRRNRRWMGIAVLAFGAGILFTFFLPISVLIVLESLVIIAAGVLFFTSC